MKTLKTELENLILHTENNLAHIKEQEQKTQATLDLIKLEKKVLEKALAFFKNQQPKNKN